MAERKIKIGLIGCGRVSATHFEALQELKERVSVVAVCDGNEDKLSNAVKKSGARGFSNLDDMLNNSELDLLTVTTPSGLHALQVIQASKKVKNIVTEKPMAIKWQDGVEMYDQCQKNGANLFVIYQNRFNNTVQAVWKAIQEGRFGRIYMVMSNVFWQRNQAYYDKDASWHGTLNMDGGAYMTQASHYVDLMQWFVQSKPKTLYANLATLARKIETEDCGVTSIEWENGTLGNINITVLTYPENLEGSITILGEKGTVKIGGVALNQVEIWEFKDKKPEDDQIKLLNYNTDSVYGKGHIKNYENILDAIEGKKEALIDGKEGLKSLRLLTAIYESHSAKKVIELL